MKNFTTKCGISTNPTLSRWRRWLALLIILVTFQSTAFSQSTITIGTGTNTTNGNSIDPIDRFYAYIKYQMVYTAAELASAGLQENDIINSLGFSVSETSVLNNYQIAMGHISSIPTSVIATPSFIVKNPFTYTPTVKDAGEFDMITFDNPFMWNGVDNIIITICSGSNSYVTPYGGVRIHTTSGNRVYSTRSDYSAQCNEVVSGTGTTSRPNIRFGYEEAPAVLCEFTTVQSVNNITFNSAKLNWTDTTPGTYEVEWMPNNVSQGSGTIITNISSTSTIINGLSPNTTYKFFVRKKCLDNEEYSYWRGPLSFTTSPSPDPVPYTQTFPTLTAPANWSLNSVSIGSSTSIPNGNANYIYKNLWSTSTANGSFTTNNMGVLPPNYRLTFKYYVGNYSSPYAAPAAGTGTTKVNISTDNGVTYTLLQEIPNNGVLKGWNSYSIDLSAYAGSYIKLKYDFTRTDGDYNIAVDDFVIEEIPSCESPTNLTVSNVTQTSVQLNWNVVSTANSYTWYVYAANANVETDEPLFTGNATTNQATIDVLSASTTYDFYVVSNCGASETSIYSFKATATTACTTPTSPGELNVTNFAVNTVTLTFETNGSDGYVVFRSLSNVPPVLTDGTNYSVSHLTEVGSLTNDGNTYFCVHNSASNTVNSTSVTPNNTSYYYLFARNGGTGSVCGTSPTYSLVATSTSVTTLPTAPTNFDATDVTLTSATINWTNPNNSGLGLTTYVEVYTDVEYTTPIEGSPFILENETSLSLENLTLGSSYYVRIKFESSVGESTYLTASFATITPGVIGNPNTSVISYNLPITAFYGYSLTQQIYTASELNSVLEEGHNIFTQIKFKTSPHNVNQLQNAEEWEVYITHTDKTQFNALSDWAPVTANDKFFDGIVSLASGSFTTIDFTTPFIWDGVSNIIITVREKKENYTSNNINWLAYTSDTNKALYYRNDYTDPNPLSPPASATGYLNMNNVIWITSEPAPDCYPPFSISVNELNHNNVDISFLTLGDAVSTQWFAFANDADPQTATPISSGTGTVSGAIITGLSEQTEYDIYLKSVCENGESEFSQKIDITTLETCPMPTGLTVEYAVDEIAKLTWNESYNNSSYEIEYGLVGYTPGTGEIVTLDTNEILLENLTYNAQYEARVRSICSSEDTTSDWSSPVTFATSNVFTYTSSINTQLSSSVTTNSITSCPGVMTIIVPPGKQIATITTSYNMSTAGDGWRSEQKSYISSPTLNNKESQVYSGSGNTGGIQTYSRSLDFAVGATGVIQFQLNAFRTYGGSGCNATYNYVVANTWQIEVTFDDVDTCPPPTISSVDPMGTSAIVNINSLNDNFEIEYGIQGFVQGTGTSLTSNSTSIEINNLTLAQNYDIYVRSLCDGEMSDWSSYVFTASPCYSASTTAQHEYIRNVTFNTLNNTTSGSHPTTGFYPQTTTVVPGEEYTLSINAQIDGDDHLYAYFDWNQNGNFYDEGEIYFIGYSNSLAVQTFSIPVRVPLDAVPGSVYMRVIIKYFQLPDPCEVYDYGETEDYLITVADIPTWTGTEWIYGTPSPTTSVKIDGPMTLGQDHPSFEVKSLLVTPNGQLNIEDETILTINGYLQNNGEATSLSVNHGGNLIQNSAFNNIGDITVIRNSQPMKRLDYTMWSSPVQGQDLKAFSSETLWNRFYIYGQNGYEQVFTNDAQDADFELGRGYLVRSPNTWSSDTPTPYVGTFQGIANNGNVSMVNPGGNFISIGNPYPSNIDADLLMAANEQINTLFFWTNSNTASGGSYSGVNNYAYFNGTGGTAAENASTVPNGIIAVGQGFIASVYNNDNIVFTNDIRTTLDATSFKPTTLERSRFWLNLFDNDGNKLSQTLVGYVENATNNLDNKYDAKVFGENTTSFYSIVNDERLVIQGRALPFDAEDVVPMSFFTEQSGRFRISLVNYDGIFEQGVTNIYLRDKELNSIHNLMESDYEFEISTGVHNERFEIIYDTENSMGIKDLTGSEIAIYKHNQNIIIDAKSQKIKAVSLFDLQGKQIHSNEKVNASQYQINTAHIGPQVVIVTVETAEGKTVNKKFVNK